MIAHKEYLCLGDTINWTVNPGGAAMQANVIGIQFSDQPGNQRLTLVKWELVKYCTIQLSTGKMVTGTLIEPNEEAEKHLNYPEQDRCN